jgi:hypothetical protein
MRISDASWQPGSFTRRADSAEDHVRTDGNRRELRAGD